MGDMTRRRALLAVAAGTAAAAGAAVARRAEAGGATAHGPGAPTPAPVPDAVVRAAREAARAFGRPVELSSGAVAASAEVLLCRSWDRSVYLHVDSAVRGFVAVDDATLAIAAACQAAGRRVAVIHWGHDAAWGGAGRFEGAILALDAADLPAVRGDVTA